MKRNLLQRALIFLPLAILLALTIESEVIDDKAIALFLLLLTALVGILFAVRYLLLHIRTNSFSRSESDGFKKLNSSTSNCRQPINICVSLTSSKTSF